MTHQQDNCRYEQICKIKSCSCADDYPYCSLFRQKANAELKEVKRREEEMRPIFYNDIGLIKRILQDFRVEGVE